MNFRSRFSRSVICLSQSLLLLAGNVTMVYAAAQGNSSLDNFEKVVFGETHPKLSENARLKDLEMNLFGKVHSGSTAYRESEISKALGGSKNDNLLLPAMAPQLDTSNGRRADSSPSPAPDSYSSDAPSITAAGDAEKETLRNAMRLYSQGKTDEAEKQFRKALSINKNSADAYYNLAVIAEGRGDLQSALSNYKAAARINPSDTDLASAISSIETKLQDKASAQQRQQQVAQQAALEQQEQRKQASLKQMIDSAATAYKNHDYDRAISNLQYVSQQAPNDGDVLYALGQAYKGKGDYARARAAYNNAIASDPGNSLYKDALASLNQIANSGSSQNSSDDGFPAAAPDRHRGRAGQLTGFTGGASSGSSYGNNSGGTGSYGSNSGNSGASSGNGNSAGQLTPFSGIANGQSTNFDDEFSNNTPGGIQYGNISSSGSSSMLGGLGGLGGLGSLGGLGIGLLGAGSMGSMLGGGVRYSGYNSMYGGRYGGSSTRIKRAAIGGLAGAAAGAMYSGMGHSGNMKSSAMKGALMGAALGLFMGGY
ncbi:MAG: tetratricopeptide repeat protein [Cyanobacteria bacterium SZAS LIN-5]|nr:tetratricopeptide repeat protein [Cyanobacteria bacterium SZAS LIN-5]